MIRAKTISTMTRLRAEYSMIFSIMMSLVCLEVPLDKGGFRGIWF